MKRTWLVAGCLVLAGCGGVKGDLGIAKSDADLMRRTLQLTLEVDVDGYTRGWQNRTTGNRGFITPTATYVSEPGVFCRDYRDMQIIKGVQRVYESRACRAGVGRWVWVEDIAAASGL